MTGHLTAQSQKWFPPNKSSFLFIFFDKEPKMESMKHTSMLHGMYNQQTVVARAQF